MRHFAAAEAVRLAPNSAEAYCCRATGHRCTGNLDQAIEAGRYLVSKRRLKEAERLEHQLDALARKVPQRLR